MNFHEEPSYAVLAFIRGSVKSLAQKSMIHNMCLSGTIWGLLHHVEWCTSKPLLLLAPKLTLALHCDALDMSIKSEGAQETIMVKDILCVYGERSEKLLVASLNIYPSELFSFEGCLVAIEQRRLYHLNFIMT